MTEFHLARKRMVETQIIRRGIRDPAVIRAMSTVPRHLFVEEAFRDQAYGDFPLPIGSGQTISQPYIVALMTSSLRLTGVEKVLEIGTGSGYQTAVLAEIAERVVTVERISSLARKTRRLLEELGYHRVVCHLSDGTLGWKDSAPYDAILVTAGSPDIPTELVEQLADGGRLVIPVGTRRHQVLKRITRDGATKNVEDLGGCVFVPLIGRSGWKEEEL
jgi:protein-L-isoaspartate(D-aspartate) O-methyltransferase